MAPQYRELVLQPTFKLANDRPVWGTDDESEFLYFTRGRSPQWLLNNAFTPAVTANVAYTKATKSEVAPLNGEHTWRQGLEFRGLRKRTKEADDSAQQSLDDGSAKPPAVDSSAKLKDVDASATPSVVDGSAQLSVVDGTVQLLSCLEAVGYKVRITFTLARLPLHATPSGVQPTKRNHTQRPVWG